MRSKKFTSLFLAILLLVSNFGFAFNVHYCGDKIASITSAFSTVTASEETNVAQKDCCCVKDEISKDSCCKNKVLDLKKDTKDVIVKIFSFHVEAPFVVVKSSELIFAKAEKIISNSNVTEYFCSPNAPPLFKIYQQYIFYA